MNYLEFHNILVENQILLEISSNIYLSAYSLFCFSFFIYIIVLSLVRLRFKIIMHLFHRVKAIKVIFDNISRNYERLFESAFYPHSPIYCIIMFLCLC